MIAESNLTGDWIHSHEEDSGNLMIFRPSSHSFPPSRGRSQYRLQAGGKLQLGQPGPTDKPEAAEGTWSLENGDILIVRPANGQPIRFNVVSVDSERLVLTKP